MWSQKPKEQRKTSALSLLNFLIYKLINDMPAEKLHFKCHVMPILNWVLQWMQYVSGMNKRQQLRSFLTGETTLLEHCLRLLPQPGTGLPPSAVGGRTTFPHWFWGQTAILILSKHGRANGRILSFKTFISQWLNSQGI